MKYLLIAFVCLSSSASHAKTETDSTMSTEADLSTFSNRQGNKLGVYMSVLGDPFPNLIGMNAAYNLTDYLRANLGYGKVSASIGESEASLTTIGAGAKGMVPGWSLTPVLGLNATYAMFSGSAITVNNLSKSGLVPYLNVGLDWQAQGGFNVGLGTNVSFSDAGSGGYLNLGYFF